jgi:hypothetical protein
LQATGVELSRTCRAECSNSHSLDAFIASLDREAFPKSLACERGRQVSPKANLVECGGRIDLDGMGVRTNNFLLRGRTANSFCSIGAASLRPW